MTVDDRAMTKTPGKKSAPAGRSARSGDIRIGVPMRVAAGLIGLQLVSVAFEGIGIGMLLPIAQYISSGGDHAALIAKGAWWRYIINFYDDLGVPLSLITLMGASLTAIVLRQVFDYLATAYRLRTRERHIHLLRRRVFATFLAANIRYQENALVGEIVNEMLVEIGHAVRALFAIVHMIAASALLILYGGGMLWLSPWMTVLMLGALSLTGIAIYPVLRRSRIVSHELTETNQWLSRFVLERLRHARQIRLSGTERAETDSIERISSLQAAKMAERQILGARIVLVLTPMAVTLGFVILYAGSQYFNLGFEVLGIFVLGMLRLLPVTQKLLKLYQSIAGAMASVKLLRRRVAELTEAAEPDSGELAFSGLERDLRFEGVAYSYADSEAPALDGIDLVVPAGALVGLVGPSGSGKSTLVDLLPRLREPSRGRLFFDGVPATDIRLAELRGAIAFVPQEPSIFNVSARDNIRFGLASASDHEIEEAARCAGAQEFIAALPDGYDTVLNDDGVRLSGGQRQRIALARAMIGKPAILILDEPTSNIDAEAEAYLQRSIAQLRRQTNMTIIIVAHRLSTIRDADMIVVLENGRVSAAGVHAELAKGANWYARALEIQSGGGCGGARQPPTPARAKPAKRKPTAQRSKQATG